MSDIKAFFEQQQKEDSERQFRMFMENARNAMRAVKVAIEEGDYEEAARLIDEALGE
jgi:HEPN domain-containing protein